jgi:hypothetical protein
MHDGKDKERSDTAKKPSDDNAKAEGNIAIVAHHQTALAVVSIAANLGATRNRTAVTISRILGSVSPGTGPI